MRCKNLFCLGALLTLGWPATARALSFDDEGAARFDAEALFTEGFEAPGADAPFDPGEDGAVEGGKYAILRQGQQGVSLPAPLPAKKGSYRARFFARGRAVRATFSVRYADSGGIGEQDAAFFPTGRVTSDGWYEVATAPLSVDGTRSPQASLTVSGSGAHVDAIEIVAEGAFRDQPACEVAHDAACGPGQFCSAGRCRDGNAMVPPLPSPAERASVAAYLRGRLLGFFGGVQTRATRLPVALDVLDKMAGAVEPWEYWNSWATALHRLRDWHTKVDGAPEAVPGRGALPICVVEGDADLSHDLWPSDPVYPDVLISHVGPEGNSGLKAGDRIVAVNGVHPLAFAHALDDIDWGYWRADDPGTHAEALERLRSVVRRWGRSVTVIRCDPATKQCQPPETLLVADLPQTEPALYPQCDHRPAYHLAEGNPDPVTHDSNGTRHGLLADSGPDEALWGMIWNDAFLDGSGNNPYEQAINDLRASAKGVVLDHRTGNGGTDLGAGYLSELFRKPPDKPLAVNSGFVGTRGWFDPPFSPDQGKQIYAARLSVDAFEVGSDDARTDLRTAVLIARDGSASDYLLYALKGAPGVRIFGRQTAGAFSSFLQFDYFGGFTWQFASGDLFDAGGVGQIGRGVQPDDEVLPRQSDLLIGKDTAYERALAWIRCKDCP